MNTQIDFVLKVLILSTLISLIVKYGGRYLPLHPTNAIATIIVFFPSLIIGLILGWRYLKQQT